MKYFAMGFVVILAVLMIPTLLIDFGAFIAHEVKMPLGALILIELGCYVPLAAIGGMIAQDDADTVARRRR